MDRIVVLMSHLWLRLSGCPVTVYHSAKYNREIGQVIVANHLSYLDPPTMYMATGGKYRSLGKAEVGKIPIFGLLYKTVVISVDRGSNADRVKSFREMKEELDKGISIMIYPEGTFDDHSEKLLPFKNGAFKLALMNQVDIQPILLMDTQKLFNIKKALHYIPGKNRVIILPSIKTSSYTQEQDNELRDDTFEYMKACLETAHQNGPEATWDFAEKWLKK
jgi:1-acyl-sn-glycerol-3-phosphate acyltransferase